MDDNEFKNAPIFIIFKSEAYWKFIMWGELMLKWMILCRKSGYIT